MVLSVTKVRGLSYVSGTQFHPLLVFPFSVIDLLYLEYSHFYRYKSCGYSVVTLFRFLVLLVRAELMCHLSVSYVTDSICLTVIYMYVFLSVSTFFLKKKHEKNV